MASLPSFTASFPIFLSVLKWEYLLRTSGTEDRLSFWMADDGSVVALPIRGGSVTGKRGFCPDCWDSIVALGVVAMGGGAGPMVS